MKTIIAIRLRQLGDVVATLGTLRALKRGSAEQRIVFIADDHYHDLLRPLDYIDVLVPQPPKITGMAGAIAYARYVEQLRSLDPDCTLDFHSNVRSSILTYFTGARVRVGFDVRVRKVFYTDVEPRAIAQGGRPVQRSAHDSAMDLARRAGLVLDEGSVYDTLPASREGVVQGREAMAALGVEERAIDNRDVIGFNPGNPYPAKAWPEAYFVELARRVVATGKRVVMLWGPGEHERVRRIADRAGDGVYVAPRLGLPALPGFLTHLALVFTIDSGLKHIAIATGVPTITVFGPTSPFEWHIAGDRRHRYLYENLSCSPCRLFECPFNTPCMTRIDPAAATAGIADLDRSLRNIAA